VRRSTVRFNESSYFRACYQTDEDAELKFTEEPVSCCYEEPPARAAEGIANEIISNNESTRINFQEGDRVL
jgi:hypothetical protein